MKIINRKRSLKLVGLQVALIVSLFSTQILMTFFAQNRILVIEPKGNGSWINIAETAEGNLSYCQSQLDQAKVDVNNQILANNPDLAK